MYIYLYAFECLLSFPLTKTAEWQLKRLDNNNGCYCSCDTIIVPPHQEAVSTALEGTVNKKARDLLKEIFGGVTPARPLYMRYYKYCMQQHKLLMEFINLIKFCSYKLFTN